MLQSDDIKQMTKYLSYKELKEGEDAWQYDEPAENFYFILRGSINLQEPNPDIPDWEWANNLYTTLKKWLKEVFNPKVL